MGDQPGFVVNDIAHSILLHLEDPFGAYDISSLVVPPQVSMSQWP